MLCLPQSHSGGIVREEGLERIITFFRTSVVTPQPRLSATAAGAGAGAGGGAPPASPPRVDLDAIGVAPTLSAASQGEGAPQPPPCRLQVDLLITLDMRIDQSLAKGLPILLVC